MILYILKNLKEFETQNEKIIYNEILDSSECNS